MSIFSNNELVAFVLASAVLLGSPGPGITALIVAGRTLGARRAMPFFLAMQAGLVLAAIVSATGLATMIDAVPGLHLAMTLAAQGYLVWLAWSIATSPVNGTSESDSRGRGLSLLGGFTLGAANPKVYLAFASLFGSFALVEPPHGWLDSVIKGLVCITVATAVDLAWVRAGAVLGRFQLTPAAERTMNLAMAAAILLALGLTLL